VTGSYQNRFKINAIPVSLPPTPFCLWSIYLNVLSPLIAVSAIGLATVGLAQEADIQNLERDFELPGDFTSILPVAGGLDLKDADIEGNPINSLSEKWPEDLVIAPIPGRSPQLGWMLTLAGGYFISPRDEESDTPPSIVGGFGMVSENGSYAYGAGANLHLLDDKLRVRAGAAYMDVLYQYYGTGKIENDLGITVDILQEAPLYFAEGTWRVWNKLYVGLGYLSGTVDTDVRFNLPQNTFLDPVETDIGAYSIPVQYDSRDNEMFPENGWLVSGRAMLYRKSAGSDFDAETFKIAINNYHSVRDKDVFAWRMMMRTTNGDAPFFLMSTFGGKTDLRGYPSGRYRDRMMYSLQGEYRWVFNDRWIFTGFAGFGEVANSFSDMGDDFLPAGGIGARFQLSKKHRVGLAADIALGNDGYEFYFGVGEAF